MGYLIALCATTAIFLLAFGAWQILATDIDVDSRIPVGPNAAVSEDVTTISDQVDSQIVKGRYGKGLTLALVRADVKLRVVEFLGLCVLVMITIMLLTTALSGSSLIGLGVGALSAFLPRVWLKRREDKRLVKFQDQLPDVLSLLVSSLRSGYGMNQALKLVTQEMPSPSREEYGRVAQELAYGYSLRESLDRLVDRTGSQDLELVVTAIKVQHEVGGNLGEILETIASTIRERVRIKGEIKVMTSSQMMTGYMLGLMPIGVGIFITMISPDYMEPLFSLPWMIIPIGAICSIGLGILVMKKMINTDY